eukprot:scaffold3022_cov150-Pinguiococcus_pyrenoidosus.AAC.6
MHFQVDAFRIVGAHAILALKRGVVAFARVALEIRMAYEGLPLLDDNVTDTVVIRNLSIKSLREAAPGSAASVSGLSRFSPASERALCRAA